MSSWLSQSTEITLSQQPYCPDSPSSSEGSSCLPKHEITTTLTTPKNYIYSIQKYIKTSFSQANKQADSTPTHSFSYKVVSAIEKVLLFGSSITSQLPKKAQTTTSSPWNLFSHSQYKGDKTLLHQLQRLKASLNTNSTNIPIRQQHQDVHSRYISPVLNRMQNKLFNTSKTVFHTKSSTSVRIHTDDQPPASSENSSQKLDRQQINGHEKLTASHQDHDPQQQKRSFHSSAQKYKHRLAPDQVIPVIAPPTIGIFSLGYLLTKQGILSDFSAYSIYKENIEISQKELEASHEERLDLIKQAIEKESTMSAWSAFTRILEWAATWINLGIATVAVISSGGVFAIGALVASLIVLIINIIDELDGWKTIVKFLPGKNKERKSKLLNFVKYALFVISALISANTIYTDNIPASSVMQGAMVAIPPALEGFISLLRGIMIAMRSRIFKIKERFLKIETQIDLHDWERQEYLSKTEDLLSNLESNFEQLSRILTLHYEINQIFIHNLR